LSAFGLSQYFGQPYLSEVFWFIPFIVQVYVIIAVFGRRLLKLNWALFFLVGACVSGLAIFALDAIMGTGLTEMRKWSPLLRLPEVGFGFMTAAILTGELSPKQYATNVLLYLGFVGLLACCSFIEPRAAYLFSYPLIGLGITALITLICLPVSWLTDRTDVTKRHLRFLGRATFPFFLIHGAGLRFLYNKFDGQPIAWVGYLLACIALALLLEFVFSAIPPKIRRGESTASRK